MKIYNSLARRKEEFEPRKSGLVSMYVCGPTVYDEPHIGHARSAYIFDVIRRYLEYKGLEVTFVRNVTDVDDKIIEKALQSSKLKAGSLKLEEEVKKISEKYLAAYHGDMASLGIGEPDKEPKATEYIPKMIKFIELLIEKGSAYASDGDVYFDIKKASHYGKLSNQNLEKMEVGARIAPGENKKDPLDFALWKSAKEGEPSWPSPWGAGRPGWHIECSVMSSCLLGDEFDIHSGGIDLIFPHHENEIAQSEGAGKRFARYWLHNGLLTIKGEKMAKSLGNFISIKDFLAKYKDGDYLKLLFLGTHYRHPVDYSKDKIDEMRSQKERFVILFDKLKKLKAQSSLARRLQRPGRAKLKVTKKKEMEGFRKKFEEAMDDDFNTPLALASLFDLVTYCNKYIDVVSISNTKKLLLELSAIFGLDLSKIVTGTQFDKKKIQELIAERDKARSEKEFKKADDIRKRLSDMGILLEDTREGTVWRSKI